MRRARHFIYFFIVMTYRNRRAVTISLRCTANSTRSIPRCLLAVLSAEPLETFNFKLIIRTVPLTFASRTALLETPRFLLSVHCTCYEKLTLLYTVNHPTELIKSGKCSGRISGTCDQTFTALYPARTHMNQ
jgi:hypothetical protein